MDNNISEMISKVLSNPEAFGKIMTLMPAVTQMMNNDGANKLSGDKIVETTAADKTEKPGKSAENLMENEQVAAAFKNLIEAVNMAQATTTGENTTEDAQAIPASVLSNNNINADNIANILGSLTKSKDNDSSDNPDNKIEKTLDTLKNFTTATSPENDHKSKLLLALKPFLKDTRKSKIDTAIKYMNAAKIINMFGKNGFV